MKAKPATTPNGDGTASAVPAVSPRKSTRKPLALRQPMSLMEAIVYAASDPAMDVAKVDHLIRLHRDMQTQTAEQAFNDAMAAAQAEMQPVAKDATNDQTSSRFASYAQLDRALRPIYTRHGFALSFDTEQAPLDLTVRVICYVTGHGFTRKYRLDLPADGKGPKGGDVQSKTHATASALSYAMRYQLRLIFNVAVGEADDDGNAAGQRPKSSAQLKRDGVWPQFEQEMRAARSLQSLQTTVEQWRPRVSRWTEKWRGAAEELHGQCYEGLGGTLQALQQTAQDLEGRP